MEDKLKRLIEANWPENRKKWALQWKRDKGKVIGIIWPNVPEEIIFAAGMLPYGVSGTWEATVPHATVHRPEMTNVFCTHVLESILNGELDFLNGLVCCQYDDDFKRLWDVIHYLHKPRFNHIMYLPHIYNKVTLEAWKRSVLGLKSAIEELACSVITEESLRKAINIYNYTRSLVKKIYELKKRDIPCLTGAETLGLTTAAKVMPRDQFNHELEQLIPYLEHRKAPLARTRPRILVSGDYLDHPSYVELIEQAGCSVVMDDLDTGSRYFWNVVDVSPNGDVWEALVKRYFKVTGPRMASWDEQIEQLIEWVHDFNIDGVIELRQLYYFPREFFFTYRRKRLQEAGIPQLFLRIDYHFSRAGMLKTRVEAFLETLRE